MTCTTQKGPQRVFHSFFFSFSISWDSACNFVMSQRPHYCELQETIRVVVTATCRECSELIASCYNLIMMPCHKFSTASHEISLTLKMDLKQTPKHSQPLGFGSQSNSLQSQLLRSRLCQNPGSEAYLFWDHICPDPKLFKLGPCLCLQTNLTVWKCYCWLAHVHWLQGMMYRALMGWVFASSGWRCRSSPSLVMSLTDALTHKYAKNKP